MIGPVQNQLREILTEAHPGWDNLSDNHDAELLLTKLTLHGNPKLTS